MILNQNKAAKSSQKSTYKLKKSIKLPSTSNSMQQSPTKFSGILWCFSTIFLHSICNLRGRQDSAFSHGSSPPTAPTLGSVSISAGAAPPLEDPSDTSWQQAMLQTPLLQKKKRIISGRFWFWWEPLFVAVFCFLNWKCKMEMVSIYRCMTITCPFQASEFQDKFYQFQSQWRNIGTSSRSDVYANAPESSWK